MSYSRWISSTWYTYWASTDTSIKEEELFACHESLEHSFDWPYSLIKRFLSEEGLLETTLQWAPDSGPCSTGDETEIEELKLYMKRFVKDVDAEYAKDRSGPENPKIFAINP